MVIRIEVSRAVRSQEQLRGLVEAILSAAPTDETRALEWKSGFADLLSREASFSIARAILGLSNRPTKVAAGAFEGTSYVVVGAEPGKLTGQSIPDGAELIAAISRFTGTGHPVWDPHAVEVSGETVLVVTVEAPREGDRIALLQKAYQPATGPLVPDGTIFVRRPGATERASRAEIDALQDRLLGGVDRATQAAREDDHDRAVRELVANIGFAIDGWAAALEVIVIMGAGNVWKFTDVTDYFNTDSGKQITEHMTTVKRSAGALRLATQDPAILESLEGVLRALDAEGAPDSSGALFNTRRESTSEERRAAYGRLNRVRAAGDALEKAAVEALSRQVSGR